MMKNYAGTILFVSHDEMLVKTVADLVYGFEDKKLVPLPGNAIVK